MRHEARAALLVAPRRIEIVDLDLPEPGPAEALVATRLGSVSPGTELACYRGSDPRMAAARYPLMTGYESVGRVLAVGADVKRSLLGQRVVATYGHRTHALVAATRLIPIPDAIDDDLALLTILAADTAVAVDRAAPESHTRVLIVGAGSLGLLTLLELLHRGATDVTVVDTNLDRLALPAGFGARTLDSDRLDAAAFDVAFECSAAPAGFEVAQAALRQRGRLVVVSDGNAGDLRLTTAFHDRELTVLGSNSHPDLAGFAPTFFARARTGSLDRYRELFDADVLFEELPSMFERLAAGQAFRKPRVIYPDT